MSSDSADTSAPPSRSTKNIADPEHFDELGYPAPITATYLSLSRVPVDLPVEGSNFGTLSILGVDQVSPSWL